MFKRLPLICACLVLPALPAKADFADSFNADLAQGHIAEAEAMAAARLLDRPDDAQAQFALGAAIFLDAVEGLGQGLYDHGLTQNFYKNGYDIPSVTDLPFLRLPVPVNPAPEPFTPEVFRQILTEFDARLAFAEATLAKVPEGPVQLPLDLTRIRLDMNGDGAAQENESLVSIIGAISGVWPEGPGLNMVVFDEGDVPWLRGYSHLLTGITDILLAHDLSEPIERTFHNAFPQSPLASSGLNQDFAARVEQFRKSQKDGCVFPYDAFEASQSVRTPELQAEIDAYHRCHDLEGQLMNESIADLVAFIHLFHWPVVDAPRLITARQHFLSMIALSRDSWALILAEADDNHEWVPSPQQQGPFPDLRITYNILNNWMNFLNQAQGVLDGQLLIPHWRFPGKGVNIRRMFEEPRTLDPVLFITGSDALPYIQDGPLAPGSTMQTGQALIFGGGLLAYFLWLN